MKGITKVSTVGMERGAWLELRRRSIGGSDAAAVIGLSKYASPYSVWAEKTGQLPDKEDSEALRLGRDLEDSVARRWMEQTGKRVARSNAIWYNEAYPFAHANIDRIVIGERAGLECKTTSTLDVRRFRDTEFPEQYYAQCVHYLAVTGLDAWYLAVLQFGRGFYTFELRRDEAEISALMAAEARFWQHVTDNTPPPVDGAEVTEDAIETIYRESRGETVELFGRRGILDERAALLRQKKELEERVREIDNIIKADMGEAETGETDGWRVTWTPQSRSSFQRGAFEKDHPGIDLDDYYSTTQTRAYRVKEIKEDI